MSARSSTIASEEKVVQERAPFWDPESVPDSNDEVFQTFIHRTPDDPRQGVGRDIPDDKYTSWLDAPNPETFASFGDEGVTASVNAFGDLMQFSSFLGAGTSGIFAADHSRTGEPYWVLGRMDDLLELSKSPNIAETGYGLRIPGLQRNQLPRLSYLCDRWPRFEFTDGDLTAKIQWVIRDKTVLQQCLITNEDSVERVVNLSFATGMKIRDLEYLDDLSEFNDGDSGYSRLASPHRYGWIISNTLPQSPPIPAPASAPERVAERSAEETQDSNGSPALEQATDIKDHVFQGSQTDPNSPPRATLDVVVVVSIFVNGVARQWEPNPDFSVAEFPITLPANTTIEVVTAYKTVLTATSHEAKAYWKDFLIPAATTNIGKYLAEVAQTFRPLSASWLDSQQGDVPRQTRTAISNSSTLEGLPKDGQSPVNHIDFVVRRNLEYILSVCAIPVRTDLSVDGEVPPIAITCGDIAGHRIVSSASFFAFKFLLEFETRLESFAVEDGVDPFRNLRRRIRRVCEGHIKWLIQTKKTDSGCFAANYWVTGEILPESEYDFPPDNSQTDTAYQLGKVAEFATVYKANANDQLLSFIQKMSKDWTKELRKLDKRGSYVWSEKKVEGASKFRLSNHVWIWRTLKAIHGYHQKAETRLENAALDRTTEAQIVQENGYLSTKPFNPGEVQREILRRFTTENDVSHKLMLATTRSSRETRFLFHASDIVLFYGLDEGLFKQISAEIWENTVEAQVHHPGNTETGWENLLRYALALMMGLRNKTLNKRTPEELVISSLRVLLQSTSPNAMFHGSIDGTTKEPVTFQNERDKDFHFHASFEIPFILLTECWKIHAIAVGQPLKAVEQSLQNSPIEFTAQASKEKYVAPMHEVAAMMTTQPKRQANVLEEDAPGKLEVRPQIIIDHPHHATNLHGRTKRSVLKTLEMKKVQPFNNHIDHSSIVDIEEEWLYNYPEFLSRDIALEDERLQKESERIQELTSDKESDEAMPSEVLKVFRTKTELETPGSHAPPTRKRSSKAVVIDVRKQVHNRKNQSIHFFRRLPPQYLGFDIFINTRLPQQEVPPHFRWLDEKGLWTVLRHPRIAKDSKKRLIWLERASKEMAFVCYVASSEDEKPAMLQFFDRHSHYETAFFEDVALALNIWYSQLHLSFYTIVDHSGLSKEEKYEAGVPEVSVAATLYTNPKKELTRATMGFRFNGDFFDRHWTCHLIEFVPGPIGPTLSRQPWGENNEMVREQDCWRQRKIFELHLFERMLKVISESTEEILDAIREELGISASKSLSSATLSSDDYFRSSPGWQRCQEILQIAEEQLSDVFAAITKWESREKDRGHERPRWTHNDERRYRPFIRRLEETNRHRIRALRKKYDNIRLVKDSLISQQERIRNDLNLRGSENIRYFTYVTVIFLPLGFAASIFSMSDVPPETSILLSMIYCAIIAVFVTVMAVVTAKPVTSRLKDFFLEIKTRRPEEVRKQAATRTDTELAAAAETFRETKQQFDQSNERAPGFFQSWLPYLFLQIPARRVLTAYFAFKTAKYSSWTTYLAVALGVAFLPIFMTTYVVQLLVYNSIDIYRSARKFFKSMQPHSNDNANDNGDEEFTMRLAEMVSPPTKYRPFKRIPEEKKEDIEPKDTRRSYEASTSRSEAGRE